MDLLDDLDVGPMRSRTFKKNIDIRIDENTESADDSESNRSVPPVLSAFDVSNSSILNTPKDSVKVPSAPSVAGLFGSASSLLDKVKRRLNGEPKEDEAEDPTQKISDENGEDEMTQQIEQDNFNQESEAEEINNSQLGELPSQTQKIEESSNQTQIELPTQVIPESSIKQLEQSVSPSPSFKLGNLEEDMTQKFETSQDEDANEQVGDEHQKDDDENDDDGEDDDEDAIKAKHKRINKLFVESDAEEEIENESKVEESNATQSRLEKIEALVAKKRAERLLREQQERDKDQKELGDYKSLEDPVNDDEYDNEDGDVSVSTIKPDRKSKADYEKQLLEDQKEYLSEQLQHEEKVVKTFDKNSLFAAFGINNPLNPTSSPAKEKSSPITSPISGSPQKVKQEFGNNDVVLSESSDEEDDFQVTDFFNEDKVKKMKDKEQQKFVLKTPFNKENTSNNGDVIELDSDSEDDEEVVPSKVTRLEVKSKFSKQTLSKLKAQKKKAVSQAQLIRQLKEKSRLQLKKRTHANEESHKLALEEVATEQEAVDKLLDRYIAAANRTREKEQEIERLRKKAEENGEEFDEEEYSDEDDFDAVPDSDGAEDDDEDEDDDAEENNEEDDDEEEEIAPIHRKLRVKGLVSDDDDDEAEESEASRDELKSKLEQDKSELNINLGSFGGNFSQKLEGLNFGGTQKLNNMLGITMTQAFETESPKVNGGSKTVNIFDQLRNNGNQIIGEESFVESSLKEKSFTYSFNSQKQEINFDEPSTQFSEIEPPTQAFSTQKDSIATLADSIPRDSFEATAKDPTQEDNDADEDEDEDDVKPAKRRLFKKPQKKLVNHSDEDDEDDEETEEQMMERRRQVELMRKKIRQRDLEAKRKKQEMKRKGLDKIMENEAEESEDEWQGIGGIDGERSDEENSEDEKMLDDYSKLKLNESQIAQLIANENLQNDEKMLHKILNDVNNGGFRKRGARNGVELEFSDEEDQVLQNYNRIRNERMRAKILEDGNLAKLSKDAKSKAFFESIAEDSQNAANDVFGNVTDNDNEGSDDEEKEDDPFNDKPEITKADFQDPSTAAPAKKRKMKLTEAYVQKTLSFLRDEEQDEVERNSIIAAHQHGFIDDDDDFTEDMSTLKQRSIIKLPETTPQRKSTVDLTNDSDQSPEKFFKMPSKIMKSFQSNSNDSFKNSNEVTVSTAYKAATSSKASIMSFGKNNSSTKVPTKVTQAKSQDTRVLKVRRVERTMKKRNRLKGLDLGNFE